MSFQSSESLFGARFERKKFPSLLCDQKNWREPDILDAPEHIVFLCVIVDSRWPNQCRLEHLRPYTCRDAEDKSKILFGWTRIDGDGWVDHVTNSIHQDDERVIAWQQVLYATPFGPEEWSDDGGHEYVEESLDV